MKKILVTFALCIFLFTSCTSVPAMIVTVPMSEDLEFLTQDVPTPKPVPTPMPTPVPTPEPTPEEVKEEVVEEEVVPYPHVDGNLPMIALTFDDGPSNVTGSILDVLSQYGGRGTFFMLGKNMDLMPDMVVRVAEQGSEIAGHTYNHKRLTTLDREQIIAQFQKTSDKASEIGGYPLALVRPPYGVYDPTVLEVAEEMGLGVIMWSIDTRDWETRDADITYEAVMSKVKDGDIILFHDVYATTADAIKRLIPELSQRFQLVTVSELIYFKQGELVPGKVYKNMY